MQVSHQEGEVSETTKLRCEANELQTLLRELQSSANEFRKSCATDEAEIDGYTTPKSTSRPTYLLNKDDMAARREKARSSWAKSATPRRGLCSTTGSPSLHAKEDALRAFNAKHTQALIGRKLLPEQLPPPPSVYDVARAEALTKTRAAAFSIPRASRGDPVATHAAQISAIEIANHERYAKSKFDCEINGGRRPVYTAPPSYFNNGGANHYVRPSDTAESEITTNPVPAQLDVADHLLSNRKRAHVAAFSKESRFGGKETAPGQSVEHVSTNRDTRTTSGTATLGRTSMTKEQWRQAKLDAAIAASQILLDKPTPMQRRVKSAAPLSADKQQLSSDSINADSGVEEVPVPLYLNEDMLLQLTPPPCTVSVPSIENVPPLSVDVGTNVGGDMDITGGTMPVSHVCSDVAEPVDTNANPAHDVTDTAVESEKIAVVEDAVLIAPESADARPATSVTFVAANDAERGNSESNPRPIKRYKISSDRTTGGRGFSFGTAPRKDPQLHTSSAATALHPAVDKAAIIVAATVSEPEKRRHATAALRLLEGLQQQPFGYDVFKADAQVRPSVMGGPVLRPVSVPISAPMPPAPLTPHEEKSIKPNAVNSGTGKAPVLAYQYRAPVAVIRPPVERSYHGNPFIAEAIAVQKHQTTPGPGTYDITKAKPSFDNIATDKRGKGKVYHPPVPKTVATLLHSATVSNIVTPGPGEYDLLKADAALRHAPVARIVAPAEGKTPQLMRKQYWEDKAADLRLEHDNLADANETLLSNRRRTTEVRIAEPEEVRLARMNEKSLKVLRKREAQREVEEEARAAREMNDVNRALVEARPRVGVDMSTKNRAFAAREKLMQSKPGVSDVMAQRQLGDKAKDRVYGPSLQVKWGNSGADDEGYESPGSSVKRMLARKEAGLSALDDAESDTTRAFLRSSLAAPRAHVVDMNVKRHEPDARAAEILMQRQLDARREKGLEAEFTGPQLQSDILETLANKPGQAVKFDLTHGRDTVKVIGKDQQVVSAFNEYRVHVADIDPHGPGAYEGLEAARDAVGKGTKPKGVAFSKLVSREDVVGPNGEAPISAAEAEWMKAFAGDEGGLYEELLMQEMLDLDYGISKDRYLELKKQTKSFTLYRNDRHEQRDKQEAAMAADPRHEHLGGSYYEEHTMVADAARSNLLAFEKRPGRAVDGSAKAGIASEEDQLMEEIMQKDFEIGFVGGKHSEPPRTEGGTLDLDVKNPNPMMPRPVDLTKFDDIEHYPRFEAKKKKRKPRVQDYLKDGTAFGSKVVSEPKDVEYDSYDSDDRPELNVERATKYLEKHTPVSVKMEAQIGRADVRSADEDLTDIERELMRDIGLDEYGNLTTQAQTEAMMKLDTDRINHVNRAIALTSKNLRMEPVSLVDMSKVQGRNETVLSVKAKESSEKAAQAELERALRKDLNDFGKGANNLARNWGIAEGRHVHEADSEQIKEIIHDITGLPVNFSDNNDHPLDLAPNPDAIKPKNHLSVVPDISKKLHEPRIAEQHPHLNTHLDYGDPDPQAGKGKFGRGLAPIKAKGEHGPGPAMHNETGRGTVTKHDEEILLKEFGDFHDIKSNAGNVLEIDARAAEAATVRNIKGGSMPGVTGRPDVRVKGDKAKQAQLSKKELEALLASGRKFQAGINEKKEAETAAKRRADLAKTAPPSANNPMVKAALKSAAAVDKKTTSIRFADQENLEKGDSVKDIQADTDSIRQSKKNEAVASLKLIDTKGTSLGPRNEQTLNIRTSTDYSVGDGLGVIMSPQPLTPLNVNAASILASTPAPPILAADEGGLDSLMAQLNLAHK